MRQVMTNAAVPVMMRFLIALWTSGPSLTLTVVETVPPTNRPLVTLPLTVEVMAPPDEIFVVAVAENVEVAFVFHVIVSFRVTGLPLANVEISIAAVLIEPLLDPLVTPPPTHALTGNTTLIVCTVNFDVRPGEIVIVPLGFPHFVPPAALAGPAVSTAMGAINATAIVNRQIFLIQLPFSSVQSGVNSPLVESL